eukprot:jgi/Ulvmu1/7047/UM033_0107.1
MRDPRYRTYPFWQNKCCSVVDWRAEAATCEGINLDSHSAKQQARASSLQVEGAANAGHLDTDSSSNQPDRIKLESFRTLQHAGHPHAYGMNSQEQIVKALLMNDTHADDGMDLVAEDLDEVLSEALDIESLEAVLDDYSHPLRQIIYSNDCLDVVDSFVGDSWQRDIIHVSSPAFTQSCLLLEESAEGRTIRHDRWPKTAMNFRVLSAAVALHAHLSADQGNRDWGILHTCPVRVAVVGAGACAIPAVIHNTHPEAEVHAVDIDNGMLQIAQSHMGVEPDSRLKLYCTDGLDFIRDGAEHNYDVVIVDVAATCLEDQSQSRPGVLLAPIPAFLSGDVFGPDAVRRSLKPDGLVAVNVVGPPAHKAAVSAALSGFQTVHEYKLADQSILIATQVHAESIIDALNDIMIYQCEGQGVLIAGMAASQTM